MKKSNLTTNVKTEESEKEEELSPSSCVRVYSLADGNASRHEPYEYRKFEFKLVWECSSQKSILKLDFYVSSAFKVATGQQSVIMNYITSIDTGLPGSCKVTKPLYAKKFSRNGFDIIMEAWPMECTLLDEIDEELFQAHSNTQTHTRHTIKLIQIQAKQQNYKIPQKRFVL